MAAAVNAVIADWGLPALTTWKVMKNAMARLAGRADGKVIRDIAQQLWVHRPSTLKRKPGVLCQSQP